MVQRRRTDQAGLVDSIAAIDIISSIIIIPNKDFAIVDGVTPHSGFLAGPGEE